MDPTRRLLLQGMAAGLLAPSLARAEALGDRRVLVLILRGGLDGLAAVPPIGDRNHTRARGEVAVTDAVDLDGQFGLHPALKPLKRWFSEGSLGIVHAAALNYRDRSHFDAQNVLESGGKRPFAVQTGWLNRAVQAMGGDVGTPMAMSRTIPLILRGKAKVTSADPLRDWLPAESLLARISDMYASDPELGEALTRAIETQDLIDPEPMNPGRDRNALRRSAETIGQLLADPDGPRIAVAEAGGWDTHAQQIQGLNRNLGGLSDAMQGLRDGLGRAWDTTAVLIVTEFGRTVHANGTGGTDHGTAGAAFALGGAVNGGRVVTDWPGLKDLHQGRDLKPTTDLRALFKGMLVGHLGMDRALVEDRVFRGTTDVEPLADLFRLA